ncbi:MAG: hypothetical protein ACJA0U_003231 [Salibacteraceae bacterium]|jgi:hypothetical protein
MKYSLVIILVTLLLNSCFSWKSKGVKKCIRIEEVPTEVVRQYSQVNSDSATILSIQLLSDNKDTNLEFTRYLIKNNLDSSYFGASTKDGKIEHSIEGGHYSIYLRNIHHPVFKADSIKIEPFSTTSFEIKLGIIGGFMTVTVRE